MIGTGRVTHKRVWMLALPIMIANITQPMLSAVDTAVVGHLPGAHNLGGVAIGAMIFSFLYWGFGFLKMGTTGFTAQAWGARDGSEVRAALARALLLGGLIGLMLIALQLPLSAIAFYMVEGSQEVESLGQLYMSIRIWSAPAALANYAILGWFVGTQNTRAALALQLVMNGANILLDLLFVFGFGWGVAGVAAATLIAEYTGVLVAVFLVLRNLRGVAGQLNWPQVLDRTKLKQAFFLNINIFIRSFCLILAFAMFTATGAKFGDVTLAANMVVQNLTQTMAYALDGFAHATEALVGSAYGAKNRSVLRQAVKLGALWSGIFALLFSLFYILAGPAILRLLTDIPEVLALADSLLPWAWIAPLLAVWCFLLDGIFVGAMRAADMRNMMLAAFAVYLAALYSLTEIWGNHGLWAALMIFFIARGASLAVRYPALERACQTRT